MCTKEHESRDNQIYVVVDKAMLRAREKGLYTADHQERVAQLAVAIACEMGLPEEQIEGIRVASLLHDIGKLLIHKYELERPFRHSDDSLNNKDRQVLREHTEKSWVMFRNMKLPGEAAQIVYQHHEKLDGSGYPRGIAGDEILLGTRILTVADVVEAMSSHRPYRPEEKTPGLDKALETISENRGILYDLNVVDICLRLFEEKRLQKLRYIFDIDDTK